MIAWKYKCVAVWGSCITPSRLLLLLVILPCTSAALASTCKDGTACSYQASQGDCDLDPEIMLIDCPKACKNPCLCVGISNDTACDCLVKAKSGYCNTTTAMKDCQTTCAKVTHESCQPLPPPGDSNASLSTWSNHYLAIVTEVCNSGYSPLVATDQGMKICSAQGQWIDDYIYGTPVICEPLDCGNPQPSLNTFNYYVKTTYGSTAVYSCFTGYIPEDGQMILTCNASGLWEGQPLTCRKVNCGQPPSSPNATYTTNGTTLGGIATYTCTSGFTVVSGNLSLACNLSEIWQGSLIVCEEVNCGQPPSSPNATYTTNSTMLGGIATYTCTTGFTVVSGNLSLACNLSKIWQGSLIVCEGSSLCCEVFSEID